MRLRQRSTAAITRSFSFERSFVEASRELPNGRYVIEDVLKRPARALCCHSVQALERANPIPLYSILDPRRTGRLLNHVDRAAKQLGKALLHILNARQALKPSRSRFQCHHDINIGAVNGGVARHRAEQ
jgi:hypothetical protein